MPEPAHDHQHPAGPDDLNQVFTSASAAMAFAYCNWDAFVAHCERAYGYTPPICVHTMHRHAGQVMAMVNEDEMPGLPE